MVVNAQLLLLPGFLCLYRYRGIIFRSMPSARIALLAVWLLLTWQWVAVTALALAASLGPARELLSWWHVPLYTSPLLPLAVVFALSCLIRSRTWTSDDQFDLLPR